MELRKKGKRLGDRLYNRLDALFCIGIWFSVSIACMFERQQSSLLVYISILVQVFVIMGPAILYCWFKPRLGQKLKSWQYHALWVFCLIVYPYSIAFTIRYFDPHNIAPAYGVSGSLATLPLLLLLLVSDWYRNQLQQWRWIRKISLEKAIFMSISVIALAWGIMATSSYGDPEYHNNERLLLGFVCRPLVIFKHFGRFLSLTAQFMIMNLCGYFYFYVNNRILVPRILKEKGIIYYCLSGLTLIAVTYPILGQLLTALPVDQLLGGMFPQNPFRMENAFAALAIILVSLPVILAAQWAQQNNRIVSLEKEKTQTELDLLKQQLNPHFFFNTLNNLYALSLQKSDQTPDSIMQLSHLTRYVIYKAQAQTVNIQDEISYLEDYIQLQQIRMKRTLQLEFTKEIAAEAPPVAPLLLIVLVENAFKHGIEPAENNAFLHLHLEMDRDHLFFSCTNSVEEPANKMPGIGLANLRRRLELLYPDKYVLETGLENHTFIAKLQVDLS